MGYSVLILRLYYHEFCFDASVHKLRLSCEDVGRSSSVGI